jgi:RNA polymerase sigma factor (TIGR02999 family)
MTGGPVTELLVRWRQGDQEALEAIVPLVYKELHDLAHGYLRREHPGHTLQSMALVHEAYLRLVDQKPLDINDRSHFIAVAARLMRQILVDYARSRGAAKRGAGLKVGLSAAAARADARAESALEIDLMALDDALSELARLDERQEKIVELRYFGGMTNEEVALALGISPATVKREWTVAKAWLARRIRQGKE